MDEFIKTNDVAAMLGVSRQTLRIWRKKGIGPKAVKHGDRWRYLRGDVDRYLRDGESRVG